MQALVQVLVQVLVLVERSHVGPVVVHLPTQVVFEMDNV